MVMAGKYPSISAKDNTVVDFPQSGESREVSDEDAATEALQLRPKGLTPAQRRMWADVVPDLVKAGRAKPLFRVFLLEFVVTLERMQSLRKWLDGNDELGEPRTWKYITIGRNGEQHRPRPEAAQYNDDFRKLNSCIAQLGISPATDLRFHGAQPDLFNDPY